MPRRHASDIPYNCSNSNPLPQVKIQAVLR